MFLKTNLSKHSNCLKLNVTYKAFRFRTAAWFWSNQDLMTKLNLEGGCKNSLFYGLHALQRPKRFPTFDISVRTTFQGFSWYALYLALHGMFIHLAGRFYT